MSSEKLRKMLDDYKGRGVISPNFETFISYADKITGNGKRAVEYAALGRNLGAVMGLRFMRVNLSRMKEVLSQAPERYKTLCAGMEDLCRRYEENVNNALNERESLTA